MNECKHEELCCTTGYWTACQAFFLITHINMKNRCHILSSFARYHLHAPPQLLHPHHQ